MVQPPDPLPGPATEREENRPLLTVILPMFNEEAVIDLALPVVERQLEALGLDWEIVCVDDGSRDRTAELLHRAHERDERVRPVVLSRNFGKEAAMSAGLVASRGDAALLMDADLQHPPELIPQMVELWEQGYDVVNAVKEQRASESFVYRFMAFVFNRLMTSAAGRDFQGASDFKLLDRQVIEAVLACPERNRFFRGLVAWVGFRVASVPFRVQQRVAGKSAWSVTGLVRYSIRNLIAFSALPLRLIAAAGFLTTLLSGALALQTLVRYFSGAAVTGFTTTILVQLLLGSVLLLSIGVLATYLAVIYEEVKLRPVFLVRKTMTRRRRPRLETRTPEP